MSPEKKPESPLDATEKSSFHRTLSSSSDGPSPSETSRPRVTFADDVVEPAGEKDSGSAPPPQGSSRRAPMQKIMLRKMGGERDGEAPGEGGKEVKQGTGGNGRQLRPGDLDAATADSAKPKTAWSSNERGPIISRKTLYEPEGKQSAAKFKKYQAQSREPPGNRGSHDAATPTSEEGTTPTGEQPEVNKREETTSPVDRAGQSSPSGKERRVPPEHRKGRRQDKGEKQPPLGDESHDQHSKAPHHRKENSRRERGGESERPEGSRPGRAARLASNEEDELGREEHDHRGKAPPPRREAHEEPRPPLLGAA